MSASPGLEAELARLELELSALAGQLRRLGLSAGAEALTRPGDPGPDAARSLAAGARLIAEVRFALIVAWQARDERDAATGRRLRDAQARLERAEAELAAIHASTTWRIAGVWGGFRRALARALRRREAAPAGEVTAPQAPRRQLAEAPLVSIVVATRNQLAALQRCLESLFLTDWPRFEVIVVDDGSQDGTAEHLAEAQRGFATLHVILNEREEGVGTAWDTGLARASGELLAYLTGDALVHREWLAALIGHLARDRELGLVAPATNAAADATRVDVGYRDLAGMAAWADRWVESHAGEAVPVSALEGTCGALRREVYRALGPFGAGEEYPARVRRAGYRLACARDAFVHHQREPGAADAPRTHPAAGAGAAEPGVPEPSPKTRPRGAGLEPLFAAVERAEGVVVFPPSIGWAHTLFQRPQHLARALAALGYVVVYDCSNVAEETSPLREIEPRLFLYRGAPGDLHGLPAPIVWTFSYNYHYGEAFPPGARVVYDWIDELAVFRVWDEALVRRNHAVALAQATLVAAVARPLLEQAQRVRGDAIYLPNAADYAHFAGPSSPSSDPKLSDPEARPVAGYYGALARWLDDALLDETAARRPDWRFVLVGPMYEGGLRGARSLRRANVVWTGPRDYAQLPGYAARFDVALIPFRLEAITRSASPLKLYEYFAAGKPVLATPLPECAAFPEVRVVNNPAELARGLDAARAHAGDARFVARLRELGRENSWQTRARTALDRLR